MSFKSKNESFDHDHVILRSSDGIAYKVDAEMIKAMSGTIRSLLDGEPMPRKTPIKLDKIRGTTLGRVIDWCVQHKDDEPIPEFGDERHTQRSTDIGVWDAAFLERNGDMPRPYNLYMAAFHLDIKGLFDLMCKFFANAIKTSLLSHENQDRALDEIRDTFQIQKDLTPDEEAQIKLENQWCEERPGH